VQEAISHVSKHADDFRELNLTDEEKMNWPGSTSPQKYQSSVTDVSEQVKNGM
jgi:hypothetical protein